MVFDFSLPSKEKNTKMFVLASLNIRTISNDCYESRLKYCFEFPSLSLVDFLQCTFMAGFRKMSGLQAAFVLSFRVTGGYRKGRKTS